MKTLLVLRHGKSSWDDPGLSDHDRPLKKRGERDAPRMGRLLNDEALVPDLIISSTAERARRTAALVSEHCGYTAGIVTTGNLYHASPGDIIKVLADMPDDHRRILIVGHNPGLEDFIESLTGKHHRMPTAALALITFDITHWSELSTSSAGTLDSIWRPKELTD